MENINLHTLLDKEAIAFLVNFQHVAKRLGRESYVVGGVVRDMFLRNPLTDFDLMLSVDAISFVKELKQRWMTEFGSYPEPKRFDAFKKYGTCKLFFESPLFLQVDQLDFSTARSETYPQPGGKPEIVFGTLLQDMQRRDFSVNAMAICLHEDANCSLFDPFHGKSHLEKKELHVLHEKSFEDDPARLLRAVRFMVRFDFTLSAKTEKLFKSAIESNAFEMLPKQRAFDEFRKLLMERSAYQMLEKLKELGLLKQIINAPVKLSSEISARQDKGSWKDVLSNLLESLSQDEKVTWCSERGVSKEVTEELLCPQKSP